MILENSKHSKCMYTCENRRGENRINLQNSKQIRWVPTPKKTERSGLLPKRSVFNFGIVPKPYSVIIKDIIHFYYWFAIYDKFYIALQLF